MILLLAESREVSTLALKNFNSSEDAAHERYKEEHVYETTLTRRCPEERRTRDHSNKQHKEAPN